MALALSVVNASSLSDVLTSGALLSIDAALAHCQDYVDSDDRSEGPVQDDDIGVDAALESREHCLSACEWYDRETLVPQVGRYDLPVGIVIFDEDELHRSPRRARLQSQNRLFPGAPAGLTHWMHLITPTL